MNSLNQHLRSKENKFVDEIEKNAYKMQQTKKGMIIHRD